MVIDIHTHIGKSNKGGVEQTRAQLLAEMKRSGVDGAAVFPVDVVGGDLVGTSLSLFRDPSPVLYPFLRFDPKTMTPEELEMLLRENPFKGVKLHPRAQNFNPLDRQLDRLYDVIGGFGIPILFHTRHEDFPHSNPDRIVTLGRQFPRINMIMGHFTDISEPALEEVGRRPNLFTDTSILSSHEEIARIARKIGADKILFGSDTPYSVMLTEMLKVIMSGLGEDDRNAILSGNAKRLLRL